MTYKGKRIASLLLIMLLCFSMALPAKADELSDTKKRQEELKQKKDKAEKEQASLNEKLDLIVEKMSEKQDEIDKKQIEISEIQDQLDIARIREKQQYQSMKLRIRYMYENSDVEFLEVLFSAENIGDFLNKLEYMQQITTYDRVELEKYNAVVKEVEDKEKQVKKEEEELQKIHAELLGDRDEIENLLAENGTELSTLDEEISENSRKLKDLVDRAQAEQDRYTNNGSSGTAGPSQIIGNGSLAWPTTSRRITSYFGPRKAPVAGATTYHDAIDIGAPIGSPVYAADAGTVITAKNGYNGGRGTYIMVDHGNGMVTRYQHLSAMYVSVGTVVNKGQNIAAVGNTGASSGPHLDFAIYINGKTVDPLKYY